MSLGALVEEVDLALGGRGGVLLVLRGEMVLVAATRRRSWQTSCRTGTRAPRVPVPKPRGWSAKVEVG